MVDVMRLKQDNDYETKARLVNQLATEGHIDSIKASLRSQVLRVLEAEKKKSYGAASKYIKQTDLSTTVTRKVISNTDGLLCAEIIREFLEFYAMEHSLHVFIPEMSLQQDFPKQRQEMEREIGIQDKDASKPLLLKLIEQAKFGGSAMPDQNQNQFPPQQQFSQPQPSNDPLTSFQQQEQQKLSSGSVSPEQPKKQSNLKKNTKKQKSTKDQSKDKQGGGSSMSHLADLPDLSGNKQNQFNHQQQNNDEFDDFGFDDDDDDDQEDNQDSSNNYSSAEKYLQDYQKEQKEGFRVEVKAPKGRVNFSNQPVYNDDNQSDEDDVDELIEEDIQTDREEQRQKELESYGNNQHAITVSQSLGIDPSVNSLELDDYDHIEIIEP